ncbi:hypothetical protein TNCV_1220041 [Trichonephila clavipes]|nr:hypothetical protein TNCV_1220041 [Trichonephila clavipes]
MDQTFSTGERSEEIADQGNSRTFSVSRNVRTILATCSRALSCRNVRFLRAKKRFVVNHTIEDAPTFDAASRVAAAMVSELRVYAAANIVELFVQTLFVLRMTPIIDSGLVMGLHDHLRGNMPVFSTASDREPLRPSAALRVTLLDRSIPYSANSQLDLRKTRGAILRYDKPQFLYATIRPLLKSETCYAFLRGITTTFHQASTFKCNLYMRNRLNNVLI